MSLPKDFAAFILTHGRPDKVLTYNSLQRSGYSGRIYLLIDDQDKTRDEYIKKYGKKNVIVFSKKAIAKKFDEADNFSDMRSIVYARNASFEVAKKLGIKYFIQLDDDYHCFQFRFDHNYTYNPKSIKNLDKVFSSLLEFYKSSKIASVAMAQGGDFIGGEDSSNASKIKPKRKCMNSFFCSTERPFKFQGRINEDVNVYTHEASKGAVFLTTNQVSLEQTTTQSSSGGMTDIYLASGTYVKSFYSVIFQPSSVKIRDMGDRNGRRLHHSVNWDCTVPKILREKTKKI